MEGDAETLPASLKARPWPSMNLRYNVEASLLPLGDPWIIGEDGPFAPGASSLTGRWDS